jgi:urease accessory protein
VDSSRAPLRSLIGQGDDRALGEIGRQARLELTFAVRDRRTVLVHAYSEPPFRVGRCLPDGHGVHLIVASSAPGIFGGDSLQQTIRVQRGARVRLTSQSAMQVHSSIDGSAATFASTYHVESGGLLDCEWDPLIPFPGARLDQQIHIDLESGATLCWSDAFMSGREARGERWQFGHLSHELRLLRAGLLAYLERHTIRPFDECPDREWVAGDACYFGTALIARPDVDSESAAELHNQLATVAGVRAAADCIEDQLLLVRLMASSGVAFHEARALALRQGSRLKA